MKKIEENTELPAIPDKQNNTGKNNAKRNAYKRGRE